MSNNKTTIPVRRSPRISSSKIDCKRQDNSQLTYEMEVDECKRRHILKTGFLYDELMLQHINKWDREHPECPDRISYIYQHLQQTTLLDKCVRLQAKIASLEELKLCHSSDYIYKIQSSSVLSEEELQMLSSAFDSVYLHSSTFKCASFAAGCAITLVKNILDDQIRNGFAIIRPPGHHAEKDRACGFCVFNNVAIAARYALQNYNLERILIVDFDVHVGQATQKEFYDDNRVLYFSTHRFENGAFWPNLKDSDFYFIGERDGLGYNVNVPFNQVGVTDSDMLAVFHHLLIPLAYEFDPELVIVSCGFDCAMNDPKGEMLISPQLFSHMIHSLKSIAGDRLALILEGGYNLEIIPKCAEYCLRSLVSESPAELISFNCHVAPSVVESILNCISVLKPNWQCMKTQAIICDCSDWPLFEGIGISCNSPTKLPKPSKLCDFVGLLDSKYDKRTVMICDKYMLGHEHRKEMHYPERPARLTAVIDAMQQLLSENESVALRVDKIDVAELDDIELVHQRSYIDQIASTATMTASALNAAERQFNSVYLCRKSFTCALLSASGVIQAVDCVLNRRANNAFAVIRPPGHHAEQDCASGFCIFNNVAIAAKYAIDRHCLKRVLIFDWDVHHGNGTQETFYEDEHVLYISIHRFDNGRFFPNNVNADAKYIGNDRGKGYNINIPFNHDSMGDGEYIAAFWQIVMPVCYSFNPQLVIVSAGFDAAGGDPLGGYSVSSACYAYMTHHLMGLAGGKIVLALEGGYNLESIARASKACLATLLGMPLPHLDYKGCCLSACKSISRVIEFIADFWPAIAAFKVRIPDTYLSYQISQDIVEQLKNLSLISAVGDNSQFEFSNVQSISDSSFVTESLSNDSAEEQKICVKYSDNENLPLQKYRKTGIIFDPSMLNHINLWDSNHIETPLRLEASWNKCVERGLVDRCLKLEPRYATVEEIRYVHCDGLIQQMATSKQLNDTELENLASKFEDIYICRESFDLALLSAGSTIEAMSSVIEHLCQNSFALVRPPGHHASTTQSCGFCLFNNVAIAAKVAIEKYGLNRVMIVDWDIHAGQGTQYCFYDDPRVLCFSIHRYQNGSFWPYLRESHWDAIGEKAGKGFHVNVPLNKVGLGHNEYLAVFRELLLPLAAEFSPELILVSAGFDSAIGCPEGEMMNHPGLYMHLIRQLMAVATQASLCVVLEGGYCIDSLAESVALTLKALLGDPCEILQNINDSVVDDSVREVIIHLVHQLKPFWNCFDSLWRFWTRFVGRKGFELAIKEPIYCGSWFRCWEPGSFLPYPTRNNYAPRSQEVSEYFADAVKGVMQSYCLKTPTFKTAVLCQDDNSTAVAFKIISDLELQEVTRLFTLNNIYEQLKLVADMLQQNQLENVIVEGVRCSDILDSFVNDQFERSFFVRLDELLSIKTCCGKSSFSWHLPFDLNQLSDSQFIFLFLQCVFPIANRIQPHLILIQVCVGQAVSVPALTFVIHLLRTLAFGRVILVTKTLHRLFIEAMVDFPTSFVAPKSAVALSDDFLNAVIDAVELSSQFTVDNRWYLMECCHVRSLESNMVKMNRNQGIGTTTFLGNPYSPQYLLPAEFSHLAEAYAVCPIMNCPHLNMVNAHIAQLSCKSLLDFICCACGDCDENWLCATCLQANCSRYIHGHAMQHFECTQHAIAVSLVDCSVWCYVCDSYLHHASLLPIRNAIFNLKFGADLPFYLSKLD